jgi:hypothetical protein
MSFNPMNKSKSSSFLFKLHNDLKDVEFYIISTKIPGVKLEMNTVKAPQINYPMPGDILTYNSLPITILSDEGFDIWCALDAFVTQTTSRPDIIYTDVETPKFEGAIYLLTNKGNVFKKVLFHDCYVEELGDYEMGIEDDKVETFTASIAYSYREVIDVETVE